MPRINIRELGLTPEQAKNKLSGLSREEARKTVETLLETNKKNQNQVESFTDKVNQLKEIKSDDYKSMAVGPNPLSREGSGFLAKSAYKIAHPVKAVKNLVTGGKQNFTGSVKNMTSKETLDNLIAIKAAGGTFGALSEKELQMLIDSATKIGNWEKTDEDGNTYYDIGEKFFDKEVNELKRLAERSIVRAGGTVAQEGGTPAKGGVTQGGIKYTIE